MFPTTPLCCLKSLLVLILLVLSFPTVVFACDPDSAICEFLNSVTVEFDEDHDHLLDDEKAMTSFASITRLWVNEQSLCNGDEDVYWGFLFDFDFAKRDEQSPRQRRGKRGKGKGRCRGRACPRQLDFSYPKRRRPNDASSDETTTLSREHKENDPCAKTLLDTLQESNAVFADVEYLSLKLTNGEEYKEYCAAEDAIDCAPQRIIIEEVLKSLELKYTLEENDHECFLSGVSCDQNLTVDDLNFDNYDTGIPLRGSISTEIGLLSSLESLNLDHNCLSGSLPTEIGNIAGLERLWLDDNKLTGTVPTEIGYLTNLRSLDLGWFGNKFTGTVPTEIGRLTLLTDLQLASNKFTGTVPTEIGHLTGLTDLWLHDNEFTGTVPTEIGHLTRLTDLSLDNNKFTGTFPTELGLLDDLNQLYVDSHLCASVLAHSSPSEDGYRLYCSWNYLDHLLAPISWLWWPSYLWLDLLFLSASVLLVLPVLPVWVPLYLLGAFGSCDC